MWLATRIVYEWCHPCAFLRSGDLGPDRNRWQGPATLEFPASNRTPLKLVSGKRPSRLTAFNCYLLFMCSLSLRRKLREAVTATGREAILVTGLHWGSVMLRGVRRALVSCSQLKEERRLSGE